MISCELLRSLFLVGFCFILSGRNTVLAGDIFPGSDAHWGKIPGGVADADGKVVYLASSSDGIEAVDAASGRVIWESKEAQRPLAIDGQRLVAQVRHGQGKANLLKIVVLDTSTGQVCSEPQTVSFPDWIAIDGGIGLTFASSATIDSDVMVLVWHANREYAGQVPLKPEEQLEMRKTESGTAQIDLKQGVSTVSIDDYPTPLKTPRPLPYYDVAGKRYSASDRQEKVPGGITIVHRLLECRDQQTGRPLWHHEIAGEVILSAIPPTAEKPSERQASPRRR
jgi:outer membrane protein assembly factor BamB